MSDKKMSKEERIGYHKGSLNTLILERNELLGVAAVAENIAAAHIKGLEKLGIKITFPKENEK